ncbi:glycosyltransferase family 4 protein [Vibrio sp. E150_011]
MKIAHIQLLPLLTGVQRVTLEEVKRLPTAEFESYIICKEAGALTEEAKKLGVNSLYVPSLVREINPLKDVKAFFELFKLFRKHKFDIVHTHSSKTGILGRVAAKLAGVPLIIHTVHGFSFPVAKGPISKMIYYAMEVVGGYCSDVIICLHEDDKNIASVKLGVPSTKLKVIPNGVDMKHFCPSVSLNISRQKMVVGMVGRLWSQKDPVTFVKAALIILESRSDVEFHLVGGGELEKPIRELIAHYGAEDQIKLLGWKTNVNEVLNVFDVFVLPSLWEGMPLAILEAQSSQLPCVVSDIPGNRHLVTDGVDGLLFSKQDPVDLAGKLNQLLDDKSLIERMGRLAREKVQRNFDINNRVRIVSELYKSELL